jgi:pyruvate formate lyase activating enzyme
MREEDGQRETTTRPVGPSRRLAGWIPTTMLDWPGKVAATVFLSGCGFRCPFCHNPRLLTPVSEPADWAALLAHLHAKRAWLDGVCVTGGEPTDDPDLPSLLSALAEAGMPVKLDTNGSHPEVLRHLIAEQLVSYVALDVKTTPGRYGEATARPELTPAVVESIELLVRSRIEHEFRTTVFPGIVTLEELPDIASMLLGGRLYALQQFRPSDTLDPHAGTVVPYHRDQLRAAARRCSSFLPTILRGAA